MWAGRYTPGSHCTFTIYEPARRFISAAPYQDRVVHHALCRVIEPLFERSFIFNSSLRTPTESRDPPGSRSLHGVLPAGHPGVPRATSACSFPA